jgi:hypothetical protein
MTTTETAATTRARKKPAARHAASVSGTIHKRLKELNDKFALPNHVVFDVLFELVPADQLEAKLETLAATMGPRVGPGAGERAKLLRQLAGSFTNEEVEALLKQKKAAA